MEYPAGTPIQLLSTEHSTYPDAEIADNKATIAEREAEIARLKELLLAQGNPAPQG